MESDSYSPPDWREQAALRMQRRAALLLPAGASVAVLFPGEEQNRSPAPDLTARATPANAASLEGYRMVATRPLKTYRPLHTALDELHPLLGRPFRRGAFFGHVGARPCGRPVPDWREEYWVREDLAPQVNAASGEFPLACVTVGGIGFAPIVGATLASLVTAIVLGTAAALTPGAAAIAVTCATLVLSTGLCIGLESWAARWFLDADAREFVLDEVAGMAATLLIAAPSSPGGVIAAFLAFRFFDVLKPGIQWIEERGWRGTIVWDDLAAGAMAGLSVLGIERGAAALGHVL